MTLPPAARPGVLLAIAGYALIIVVIGAWSALRTRDARDFFIAGQRLGLWVTGVATMSSAFSGFVFIGGPGLTYRLGMSSLFICLPVGFTAALLCWTVGRRLRLLAEVREVYTIPDALACRFGSPAATSLSAAAIVVGSIGYLAAQLLALGVLLEAALGTRETWGETGLALAIGAGLLIVVGYSFIGGMVAGAYTDLVQGLLMMTTAVLVFGSAVHAAGGLSQIGTSIAASPAFGDAFLEPLGRASAWTAFGLFFVFGVGTLGQPHMLHKFFMLDDPRKLRWLPSVLAGSQTLSLLMWVGLGLAVPALVAQGRMDPLEHPDEATPAFLLHFASEPLAGLAIAGALAAIMSTADSFLNIAAAALVRDLPRALGRPLRRELAWGRWATLAVGGAAGAAAWLYGDLIALLGTFAFGTFAAALAPVLAVGLCWERVHARAAVASIATGLSLNLILELIRTRTQLADSPWWPLTAEIPPACLALAASFVVLLAVSLLVRSPSHGRGGDQHEIDDDVRLALSL
ncbi:MAG: hypothetical protein JSV80_16655 [Acidobacteriota bacterium]|nr:MAG: hypothetical protein JSV80_16655 [Acidobacteriota bacterium]